jgi:hypothetical protein
MQEMAALYEGFRFAAHPRYDLSPMKGSVRVVACINEGFRFAAHPRYNLSPSGLRYRYVLSFAGG